MIRGQHTADDIFTLPTLPDGVNTITAQVQDLSGNLSQISNPITISIDTRSPSVVFSLDPASDTDVPGDRRTSLQIVRVNGSTDAGSLISFPDLNLAALATKDGTFSIDNVSLVLGENQLRYDVSDSSGNAFSGSIRFYRDGSVAVAATNAAVTQETVNSNAPPAQSRTHSQKRIRQGCHKQRLSRSILCGTDCLLMMWILTAITCGYTVRRRQYARCKGVD